MGKCKVSVPVNLEAETVARIDEFVEQFSPFCEGRSALVRVLIEHALGAIDEGILKFDLESIKEVLRKSESRERKRKGEVSTLTSLRVK